MRILVTGGAGFIGSHIVKQLLEAGHEVVVYDIAEESKASKETEVSKVIQLAKSYEHSTHPTPPIRSTPFFVQGDVRDSKKLLEALQGVDAVIHMASFISVEESVKNPLKYMDNNVLGTAYLLTAMREAGVKKIVFSSSATVYGEPKSLPILEDAPLSAANPYAASKIAMEALCESFYRTDGFDVTVLRYFNPYGPGENHNPETHAIPNFIKAGLSQGESVKRKGERLEKGKGLSVKGKDGNNDFTLHSSPLTLGNKIPLYWGGEQVRDFIYVEDLAETHIRVLGDQGNWGDMGDKGGYRIFNVGSDRGVKIIDIINKLSDILGYDLDIEDLGEREGDVMANYASSAKLKEATGWEAKVGLEEGLARTVAWFKNKGNMGEKGN